MSPARCSVCSRMTMVYPDGYDNALCEFDEQFAKVLQHANREQRESFRKEYYEIKGIVDNRGMLCVMCPNMGVRLARWKIFYRKSDDQEKYFIKYFCTRCKDEFKKKELTYIIINDKKLF